ncbi:response regulator transcription factor [Actinomyces procaprae]|uniref:response regulator transcription factor n=1 Tax=Actinomyces procaprae TaxID=2560010 RepID=UPI00109E32DE|nr:response regulator transcription factor [Actinomyces procaprae]
MRIVLADDAALLREGLAGLLIAAGYEVVAQVADADALREEVERLAAAGALPDVVVTDVRMPPTGTDDGLRAAIDLRTAHPGLPVIVLSAYVAGPYLRELLDGPDAAAGGVGYLLKERVGRVSDFMRSLEVVAAGGVVVDPEVLARLMHADNAAPSADGGSALPRIDRYEHGGGRGAAAGTPGSGKQHTALARLTPREQEVLALMAEGLSNPQVAERLVLSDGAVAKHVANIFAKLDLPPDQGNRRVRAVLTWLRARA